MRKVLTLVVIGAMALMALCAGCKKGGTAASSDPSAGPATVKANMAKGGGTSAGAVPAPTGGKAAPAGEKAGEKPADEKK
jgi:hypothetical protein